MVKRMSIGKVAHALGLDEGYICRSVETGKYGRPFGKIVDGAISYSTAAKVVKKNWMPGKSRNAAMGRLYAAFLDDGIETFTLQDVGPLPDRDPACG